MRRFEFQPTEARRWDGRYTRIPGETTVFHVRHIEGALRVAIDWDIDADRCTCVALGGAAVEVLAEKVVQAKRKMGGHGGGSFQINEFGQVLVPASDGDDRRLLVGQTRGSLRFDDPRDGGTFTLGDADGLSSGDPWPLPYIGMYFNVGRRGRVYCKREGEESSEAEYLPRSNPKLVKALRGIRGHVPIRFLVNPERIVLTKRQLPGQMYYSDEDWEPTFVGKLDLRQWFEKEN